MPRTPNPETTAERCRRLIVAAVRAVPRGQVAGYGEVARRAGLPGRARLVARILAAGDEPGLPWHRVLRSDGRIAFPEGSQGYDEQTRRLRAEGVRVEAGRVRGQSAAATLDELLWAPPADADRRSGKGGGAKSLRARGRATGDSGGKPPGAGKSPVRPRARAGGTTPRR